MNSANAAFDLEMHANGIYGAGCCEACASCASLVHRIKRLILNCIYSVVMSFDNLYYVF